MTSFHFFVCGILNPLTAWNKIIMGTAIMEKVILAKTKTPASFEAGVFV